MTTGTHPYLYPNGKDELFSIRHHLKKEFLHNLSSGCVTMVTLTLALKFARYAHTDVKCAHSQNNILHYLKINQM